MELMSFKFYFSFESHKGNYKEVTFWNAKHILLKYSFYSDFFKTVLKDKLFYF